MARQAQRCLTGRCSPGHEVARGKSRLGCRRDARGGSRRTTRDQQSEYARPETIEETADLISAAGGDGIAVKVDHLVAGEVGKLIDRIRDEQRRLDILIND